MKKKHLVIGAFFLLFGTNSLLFINGTTSTLPPDLFQQFQLDFAESKFNDTRGRIAEKRVQNSDGSHSGEMHISHEPPIDILQNRDDEYAHPLAGTILRMIDASPKGSIIRIAGYHFHNTNYSKALVKAVKRGVRVRLILSNANYISPDMPGYDPNSRASLNVQSILDAQAVSPYPSQDDQFVLICTKGTAGACVGDGKNHNKFFLFSSICRFGLTSKNECVKKSTINDNIDYIVVQTSLNMTYDQLNKLNISSVNYGDQVHYDAYRIYFNKLYDNSDKAPIENFNYQKQIAKGSSTIQIYALPRSTNGDPVGRDAFAGHLSAVKCLSSDNKATVIKVSQAHWTDSSRGRMLINELDRKRKEGCIVKVLNADEAVFDKILLSGISIRRIYQGINKNASNHTKFAIIDSPNAAEDILMYGSMSFTSPSHSSNDETWIVWKNPSVTAFKFYNDVFERQWNTMGATSHIEVHGGCKMNGSNTGCQTSVSCPSGYSPAGVKTSCNLELKKSADIIEQANTLSAWNKLSVVIPSNNKSSCTLNGKTITSGTIDVQPKKGANTMGCFENENNGGECRVFTRLLCRPNTF